MGLIRPATPGFIVTLVATILLAVVSFCVPYFKSVFFLKASISVGSTSGNITFGTLGYCVELASGTNCSSPSVGYELDINALVGNKLPVSIPQVAVKWLTYALVLHIVALALAAGSAVFGLLAHIREMSMTCCSTCVSGFAAVVTLLAFIFDLALFFVAKSRINAVGKAEIGNAIWLTLAAWILLFFSGCFYTLGRCCISKRKPRESGPPGGGHAEQMRLDAVKAEADRKAKQKATEGGLPAFYETQPLTGHVDGDSVYTDPYKDSHQTPSSPGGYGGRPAGGGGYAGGGYVKAPVGSRAVDEYYNPTPAPAANTPSTYPPAPQTQYQTPRRQPSGYAPSAYAPSVYSTTQPPPTNSPPPINQYLAGNTQHYGPERYGSPPQGYGHTAGGTSYHTAASHQQYPSNYAYDSQRQRSEPAFNPDTYNNTGYLSPSHTGYANTTNNYSAQATPPQVQHDRSYTLGGDGYGANSVPPLQEEPSSYFPYPGDAHGSPAQINTNVAYVSPPQTSPVKGPRSQPQQSQQSHHDYDREEAPPGYDAGTSNITGAWGKN
ncbi:SUR7/PalI family-domain-containing protein [Infundibulicybe gibba]|nr:SUR7/PalI family-domain-containing protein [Infundibulicybe gibba]